MHFPFCVFFFHLGDYAKDFGHTQSPLDVLLWSPSQQQPVQGPGALAPPRYGCVPRQGEIWAGATKRRLEVRVIIYERHSWLWLLFSRYQNVTCCLLYFKTRMFVLSRLTVPYYVHFPCFGNKLTAFRWFLKKNKTQKKTTNCANLHLQSNALF